MLLRQISAHHPHLRQGKKPRHLVWRRTVSRAQPNQGLRETLAVGQPTEQHVQEAQDLRKAGLVRNLFIRQVKAA